MRFDGAPPVALEVKGLHVGFGPAEVLRGIDLAIPEKGILALIGPTGCGKTTLLKALNRLNELEDGCHTAGEVLLDGKDVYAPASPPYLLRQRVGMVFQKPAIFDMSIYDNVAFAPRLYGGKSRSELDTIVEDALEATGLWDEVKARLKRRAESLTDSQKQRLCIARVLASEPEVLLMDEPTAGMDMSDTARIEELVLNIARYRAVVLATHDLSQAARISDHTALLLAGEIVEKGPTEAFFSFPKDIRTKRFISGSPG